MALRLWENDPESAPRPKSSFADDIVGRFRSGYVANKNPVALKEWRVTTGDPDVAAAVFELLGGEEPEEWDATGEDNLQVFSAASSLDIILASPKAVSSEMIQWSRNNKVIRRCDGVSQGDPNQGEPCACPSALQDRKDASKAGTGCDPQITVWFRLAANPELGIFKFQTGSWSMVKEIGPEEEALAAIDGPARATLTLEPVAYTTKAGRDVAFTKPVLKVLGPAE